MRKPSLIPEKISDFDKGSRNWLLHARYVRGEHGACLDLADNLQKESDNAHRFAHYVKGLVLADAGRLQEALEKFHSCIRLQPQDSEALQQVAKCLYRQGRFQLSYEAYLEANKLTKKPDPNIHCALAECAMHLGDITKGVEWAKSAVEADGGEKAGALLASLLVASDDIPGALEAYDAAMSTHACGAETLASAGALRLRSGDPRRAFQLLGAALAQQPTHHAAAVALAAMMLQHRDLDASLARLKAALTAHPTCIAAHSDLGLALMAKKKYIAAVTCLQRAAWTAPLSARAAHNLGLALIVCRRPTSAFCRLAAATALHPAQPHTVLLIGIVLERLQDGRADAAYARATAMDPEDPLIRLNLAGRHARAGRLNEALEEATYTAQLLRQQGKTNSMLAGALANLFELLKDIMEDVAEVPQDLPNSERVEEIATPEEYDFSADEV